jgi:hypothetical protein
MDSMYPDFDYDYTSPSTGWPFDPHPLDDPLLAPRITIGGSLDPATGIFYRTPEHPRLRTAQACEKCRSRKAKVCFSLLLFSLFLCSFRMSHISLL